MASAFSSLKKSGNSLVQKLATEADKLVKNKSYEDDRFWEPTIDKAGNGSAVIRFLPQPKDEDLPWVRIWRHSFKGPGGWYIENSLTTLGKSDPVSEDNTRLWDTGIEANKDIARARKRQLTYISWILVVNDPGNPDNNGKVFLYKYGKKIFDKINELMNPSDPNETKINPFDMWEGADFKLKIKKVGGFRNYDSSSFDSPSPIKLNKKALSDKELEAIWEQETPLQEFLKPENFKSYDELLKRFNKVVGLKSPVSRNTRVEDEDETSDAVSAPTTDSAPFDVDGEDEDDDIKRFRSLAEED